MDSYDLTMPVLSDRNSEQLWAFANGASSIGLPFSILLEPGLVIIDNNYPTERDVRNALGG